MRLLKLKLRNIASLKGEHQVSFKEIEALSPLFAITGETGAGKSTLLNCLGLALYGDVYKTTVDQLDVVTLGEKEGQIELIFQVKGKTYYAFWKGRVRKQNGELYAVRQSPQRELYELQGEDFDAPKSIVTKKAEEILNLDFSQFCKCVILNQGEFARFLTSSFSERKEILERLYPGELLDSVGRELRTQLEDLQRSKSDLEIELATLKGDAPVEGDLAAEKARLTSEITLSERWLTHLESFDFHYASLVSYHQKHHEIRRKLSLLADDLARATTTYNATLADAQLLEQDLGAKKKLEAERLPELQALLKVEEGLKLLREQKIASSAALEKGQAELKQIQARLGRNREFIGAWKEKEEKIARGFVHPLAQLIRERAKLAQLLELEAQLRELTSELTLREARMRELEAEGKKHGALQKELQDKIRAFGDLSPQQLGELEAQKKDLKQRWEQKQKAQVLVQEIEQNLAELGQQQSTFQQKSATLTQELARAQADLLPIDTTLKLQTLMVAVEVCLTHPAVENECPVCQRALGAEQWTKLRQNLTKTNVAELKEREAELIKLIAGIEAEEKQLRTQLVATEKQREKRQEELKLQTITATLALRELATVDQEIAQLQEKVWLLEKHKQDEAKTNQELGRARQQYAELKTEFAKKDELRKSWADQRAQLLSTLSFVAPTGLEALKTDLKHRTEALEPTNQGEKLEQEDRHLSEGLARAQGQLQEEEKKLAHLTSELAREAAKLGARSPAELIRELKADVEAAGQRVGAKEKERTTLAEEMKLKQGQKHTLDENLRDTDMLFARERHALREAAQVSLPPLTSELTLLTEKLRALGLELTSEAQLFVPLKELLGQELARTKASATEKKLARAKIEERLASWEKRQDRIQLLELKKKDLIKDLERKLRLFEVLGKDELRTFVLSLVEENLIVQTNEELQKLCQGRYEIIHQAGRARLPEFYILDKFREGEMRKVSTLSGGETFMVSLAMALGLAEMTRGQAEIDSLFIDEGFGTLDQDSLEDVVDMLKQIQTRGLMVGIISHIKALTNSVPVNLLVSKSQDGTSKLQIVQN